MRSTKTLSRWMRLGIATITSTALVGGMVVAAPSHPLLPASSLAQAQAQEAPFATATGQVIDLSLLQDSVDPTDEDAFLDLLEAIRADAQFPGNETDSGQLDLTLLEGIDLNLGTLSIPLVDLLGIQGDVGVLGASAATPAGNEAAASAGVLNDDGSINLDAHQGTGGVETVLDLTTLLQGGGVDAITNGVIDELSLRLGAASASAERNGDEVTSEYALANVGLNLDSPLIGDLTTALIGDDAANPGLGLQLDNAVSALAGDASLLSGVTDLLGGVLNLLRDLSLGLVDIDGPTLALSTDLQGTLEGLLGGTIASESGLVSIDLATGQISVNLEKLAGTSAAAPNTDLLSEVAVQQISSELNTLLNSLLDNVETAVFDGLLNTGVRVELGASLLLPLADISLDGTLNQFLAADEDVINLELFGVNSPTLESTLLGVLGTVGNTVDTALDGVVRPLVDVVVGDLLAEVVAPLTGGISSTLSDADVLSLRLNAQPNPQVGFTRDNPARPNAATGAITNPDDPFTVSALHVRVLGGLVDLPLARATVNADPDWTDPDAPGAPAIEDIADQTVTVGSPIAAVTPEVTPDDATVTVEGLPAGVTFADGVISGSPSAVGSSTVTVIATNDEGEARTTFTITAETDGTDGPEDPAAPTIGDIANQTVTVGEAIAPVTPSATPEDATIEVVGLPAGVTFENGVIAGAPTAEGTNVVTVTATSGTAVASTTFSITAEPVQVDAPNVGDIDNQTITIGESITDVTPVVAPADAEVTVIGLPAGVTYEDGVISGTPTTIGSAVVTVSATNSAGTDTSRFTITTNPTSGPAAPTLENIADQTITLGESIAEVIPVAVPADADIEVVGLPTGVTFDGDVISGAPTAEGTTVVTVTATTPVGLATSTFSITVNPVDVDAPSVDNIDDQTITLGESIADVAPVVTPDDADVTVVGLPAGVTYEGGVISGTPTNVGSATVTVIARNSAGADTARFTITTNRADSDAPVITPIDDQDGIVGEEIDDIPVVVVPEESEVDVDGLPDGIEYDPETGIIAGTPAEGTEGSHTIIVTATNDGETATETFLLVIREAGTTPPPASGGSENGSSEFLQQCMNSPAAGVAGLLVVLGAVGAIGGPALEPMFKAIGGELDRQLRMMVNVTAGAHQPVWVRNINKGLNDAANAVDHRMVTNALFATAALALATSPILCGMDNSSSGSSESN